MVADGALVDGRRAGQLRAACGALAVTAEWLDGLCGDAASVFSSRTTPLRRSMHATPTAAERGQVPEREAPWPSKKTLL